MQTTHVTEQQVGVSDNSHETVKLLLRIGYIAKGAVYVTVGILAASAVFGWFGGNDVEGTRGAVEAIAAQPFGNFLLILLVAGLAGYVLWRFVQAFMDTENKGNDAKGWVQRIGFMISGVTYAALAWYAISLSGWFDAGTSGGGSQKTELTAKLMQSEAGILVVGVAGLVFIVLGLYQGYRAISGKFKENWQTEDMSQSEEHIATRLAQFGIGIRAVTFVIIGSLIIKAAMDADPSRDTGLGEALRTIAEQPYGHAALVATAVGLVCYGIYCFINSRYRAMTIR
jgi:hypothetical protein